MGEPTRPPSRYSGPSLRDWQGQLRWFLTVVVVACLVWVWLGVGEEDPEDAGGTNRIQIESMSPLEVSPGGVVAIRVSNLELPPEGKPLTASVDKTPVEVLDQRGDTVVMRLPSDIREGRAKVRVHQGKEKSKGRDIWVRPLNVLQVLEHAIGGLALFVLGIRTLARGIRTYSGSRLRYALARMTQGVWRSMGVGVLAGAVTQSHVSSAGILVGLLRANLLQPARALILLLGAQLGAAAMALILPLGFHGAMLLVALGVIWVGLAINRRGRALGKLMLGVGMLFFGLEVLRTGFAPLVAAPQVLGWLSTNDMWPPLVQISLSTGGALATALLQGPGAPFLLVLGLAESSPAVGLSQALAVLSGVPFGVAVASAAVAWPFGGACRRLAVAHLITGALLTLFLALTGPAWAAIADVLVPGDPDSIGAGERVLEPATGAHLALAFALSELFAVGCAVLLIARFPRALEAKRTTSASQTGRLPLTGDAPWSESLVVALSNCRQVLQHVRQMVTSGDRSLATACEQALNAGGGAARELVRRARVSTHPQSQLGFSVGLSLVLIHRSLVSLERTAETLLETEVVPEGGEAGALDQVHQLTIQGVESLLACADEPSAVDLDSAREREIWLNAEEAKARARLERNRSQYASEHVQELSQLYAAYEELGNHIFRAHELLAGEMGED